MSPDETPPTGAMPLLAHEEAERTPDDEEARQEADRRRRTQHPFNTKDKDTIAIYFIRGDAEPQPNPDMCTVIYELTPLGDAVLHRVVPRSRWPRDRGRVEDF